MKISFEQNIEDLIEFNEFTIKSNKNLDYYNNLFRFIVFLGISFTFSHIYQLMAPTIAKILLASLILGFIILDFFFNFNFETIALKSSRHSLLKKIENNNLRKFVGYKTIEILETGCKGTTAFGSELVSWKKLKNIVEAPNAYYIYLDSFFCIIIPKRAFETKDQMIEFKNYTNKYLNQTS